MANCQFAGVSEGLAILLRLRVRDLSVLFVHALPTVVRLAGPAGVRAVVAESLLVKLLGNCDRASVRRFKRQLGIEDVLHRVPLS
jgi:hypothetical protein